MNKEHEDAVLRITARYVAEMQAGQHPRLSDYLARYPQYADAIADFVAYYHAFEANEPSETPVDVLLSDVSPAALKRLRRILSSESNYPKQILQQPHRNRQGKKRLPRVAEENTGYPVPPLDTHLK